MKCMQSSKQVYDKAGTYVLLYIMSIDIIYEALANINIIFEHICACEPCLLFDHTHMYVGIIYL